MPSTWGYAILAVAALIGIGTLLLPQPEPVDVATYEVQESTPVRRPPTPQARARPKTEPAAKTKPKPKPQPAKPAGLPMQNTVGGRLQSPSSQGR
jgi:hypothetical protein